MERNSQRYLSIGFVISGFVIHGLIIDMELKWWFEFTDIFA
jgi:hypothetical protein